MLEIADIHVPFAKWLDERGIPYHRNRSDKRTTAAKGDPDFLCVWCAHAVYIECKVPGRKLSKDQEKRIAYLRKAGNKVVIAYSLQECVEAAKGILCHGEDKNDVARRTETVDWPSKLSDEERSRITRAADAARERVSKMPQDERKKLLRNAFAIAKAAPTTQNTAERESLSKPAPSLFIADWKGAPCVFQTSLSLPNSSSGFFVRVATPYDILNIPRR